MRHTAKQIVKKQTMNKYLCGAIYAVSPIVLWAVSFFIISLFVSEGAFDAGGWIVNIIAYSVLLCLGGCASLAILAYYIIVIMIWTDKIYKH